MNKTLLSMAAGGLFILSSAGHAHDIPQGTFELGGNLDLSVLSSETKLRGGGFVETFDTDTTTLELTGLYYIADNIGIGISWTYESEETSFEGDSMETTMHLFGPTARFNFSLNDNTSLFLRGSFGYASLEEKGSFFSTSSADGYMYSFGGGISYFFNDYVSLNGAIDYASVTVDIDSASSEIEISGVNVSLGLSIYL